LLRRHPWLTAAAGVALIGVAVAATGVRKAPQAHDAQRVSPPAPSAPSAAPVSGVRMGVATRRELRAVGVDPDALRPPAEVFPIAGPHDLGRSIANRFGGGRGHEGQDMFARCGTPLVAAHEAKVARAEYQGAAGNYVVLAERDGEALAYMHLRDPALVEVGDRVSAGERVGFVGDSGRADGCHLHLEHWTAPGYYTGGAPVDPLPWLERLDRAR
jgi:murein DD-endopeptidase MepM/ murein hydrolase activator NlpD